MVGIEKTAIDRTDLFMVSGVWHCCGDGDTRVHGNPGTYLYTYADAHTDPDTHGYASPALLNKGW